MTVVMCNGLEVRENEDGKFEIYQYGKRQATLPTSKKAWEHAEIISGIPIARFERLTVYLNLKGEQQCL